MNKTVTINLSGIVFHIDENAYDTLKKYLESIRSKFTVADGRDEIVSDIEARIAEMFQQRISDSKQAILPDDVNAVITILGKPEDISEAPETPAASATEPVAGEPVYNVKKRFFRSPDDKILGGVCGGISAYFDIDPIWLRLAFALAFFFGGSGILIYIILWVIVPMAKTPSEKLQMRGEDVTLSGIQKSVQDELEDVKNKAGEMVNEVRSKNYGSRLSDFIREVVVMFFKVIGKILSVIFISAGLLILFVLTVLLFCAFGLFGFAVHNHMFMMLAPHHDMFLGLLGVLLLLGVPAVMLFLVGLKWLFKINWNLKKAGAIFTGLLLIGLGICLIITFSISKYYATSASVSATTAWQVPAKKVLYIKLNPASIKATSVVIGNGSFTFNDEDGDSVAHGRVTLRFVPSDNDSVQLVTNYISRGQNHSEAYTLAKKIQYNYSATDTTLLLDSHCSLGQNDAWRAQKVALTLKIPIGTSIKLDHNLSVEDFIFEISAVDDINSDEFYGHIFTMTNDGLKCVDCNDMPDEDNGTTDRNKGTEYIHHKKDKIKHIDSLKMKIGHTSSDNTNIIFTNYMDETPHTDNPISYPLAAVKETVNQYSDSFIAYLNNTLHPDEVVSYVDDMYNTGKTYASAFNDYLKSAIDPGDAINYQPNNNQLADNMNSNFINYLKSSVPADEAYNYGVGNTNTFAGEKETANTTLVLH